MGTGGYLNDKADITAPTRSYMPNDFGLYNMAGNVNEWTADVYRKLSFEDFEDFNPFRGNQYTDKRLADPSKGLYAKDKYGRPIKDPAPANRKQTWEELNNVRPADTTAVVAGTATQKPFNPDFRGHLDTVNQDLYGVTTLVNNRSRVYKGGSWNDRAYWLNPATRRFMQQDETSAELGFRCAMTLMGNPEISSRNKPHLSR
jgi:formylglycine-generating enzyme required for sulfatase activity